MSPAVKRKTPIRCRWCRVEFPTRLACRDHAVAAHHAEEIQSRSRRVKAWKHTRAAEMRDAPTRAERALREALTRRTTLMFLCQAPLYGYIADFYFPRHRLIVEVDGSSHRPEADARRDAALLRRGLKTLRFTNARVLNPAAMDEILDLIRATYA